MRCEALNINREDKEFPTSLKSYADILDQFEKESRLRSLPKDREVDDGYDLSSNDYMGLGKSSLTEEFTKTISNLRFSSSASRLLSGYQNSYERLESLLGNLYGKGVLLFNSGYHANVGIIESLAIEGTVFLCDKLIHASMIDGLKLGNAEYRRWKHNDLKSLKILLDKYSNAPRVVVMVESIYSMDGDTASLKEIVELKNQYPSVILYVDEAHAFGVRGERGLGLCEELGILTDVDILIGTMGKACASSGAFVATHSMMKQYFMNSCRSFIFSTAFPPVCAEWSYQMINRLVEMKDERRHLKRISQLFRDGIAKLTGRDTGSNSQIIPLKIGDAKMAVVMADRLSASGITALPIRRPTVAKGEERIRFSLSSDLSETDINLILNKVKAEYEVLFAFT